jgi:formate dehydrogenase subunit delta
MNDETAIHHDPAGKLLHMGREIADFFKTYPPDDAAARIANHINRFWTPKMREDFLAASKDKATELPPQLVAARNAIKRKKNDQEK